MPRPTAQGRRSPKDDVDALLFEILSKIAAILVSTGYGFSRVNELTKVAFVRAAHSGDLQPGTILSIARIAALTGITRTEVSKIPRLRDAMPLAIGKPTNRIARVASGWATDSKFQKNARPRRLAFAGSGITFSTLVRRFSGDIPPKAMLREMTRLGMVRQDQRGLLLLVRSRSVQSPRTTNALKAAIPWISFLAGSTTAPVDSELTSRSDKVELKFSSLPQVFAAMRELDGRHRAFVNAIEQLGSRVDGLGRYSLNVSVAIAATNPRVSTSRRRFGPKGKRARMAK